MTLSYAGNMVVAGSVSCDSLTTDTRVYNSGGNASLKIQGNKYKS